MDRVIETNGAEETFALGKELGEQATAGAVFTLNGDLGVGKTVFAQGFAEGLGITEAVNSPTFTILQVYEEGRLPLYHFDVYRIEDPEEMYEVGFDDYLYGQGVCLIEWAEQVAELLPQKRTDITIEKDLTRDFSYRKITIRMTEGERV
ncbi:MAG: tRNA (adenosine(37)-N6)-threonylcarbamoyltransferase complex ATPase subunit type 1 TsaE [Lachnospiraceae bacterium]|nr:tRNA (adenosine(37)-N6)-threonylcarbamoyltransferase complex ATPase subunit type 1 TsaE [Lachnospiraceae bacterium]